MPNLTTLETVRPFTNALQQVSNLDENQAKTILYFCVMTNSDKPRIRPLLDLNGETSSGKTSIMKQIMPWCHDPKRINARNITSAELRDQLADTITAFVEEADKVRDLKEAENWYQNRYEDTGENISYRRQVVIGNNRSIYRRETHKHFGYTLLHTQNPFESTEMDRRILRINLVKDSSKNYTSTEVDPCPLILLAADVDWSKQFEQALSNSAWDVWLPLVRVADHLGDTSFLEYTEGQIKIKTEEDDLSKVFEPKGVVLSEIAPLYEACLKGRKTKIPITDIRAGIQERGYMVIERKIVGFARQLGFQVYYPKNKASIKVQSREELKQIFEKEGLGQNYEESDDSGELITHTALLALSV